MMDAACAMIWLFLLIVDIVEPKHEHSAQLIIAHAVLFMCFVRLATIGG